MQKWVENFSREWVEQSPFLAMPADANAIANLSPNLHNFLR